MGTYVSLLGEYYKIWLILVVAWTALYTTPQVMDSVKRAQEQISATVLSRALQMCKDNLVITNPYIYCMKSLKYIQI